MSYKQPMHAEYLEFFLWWLSCLAAYSHPSSPTMQDCMISFKGDSDNKESISLKYISTISNGCSVSFLRARYFSDKSRICVNLIGM
jgi:hypothetical protein